jgi:hypothetical protein
VLRDGRLRDAEPLDELVDRDRAVDAFAGEQVDDLPPPGLGDGVEGVGRGRRSGHDALSIFLNGNISSPLLKIF